jgi:hypothetical protein
MIAASADIPARAPAGNLAQNIERISQPAQCGGVEHGARQHFLKRASSAQRLAIRFPLSTVET